LAHRDWEHACAEDGQQDSEEYTSGSERSREREARDQSTERVKVRSWKGEKQQRDVPDTLVRYDTTQGSRIDSEFASFTRTNGLPSILASELDKSVYERSTRNVRRKERDGYFDKIWFVEKV
jgi:hypothetical protein